MKFYVFVRSKHGEGTSLSIFFFLLYLSVHWGDFIGQIKKDLSRTLKMEKLPLIGQDIVITKKHVFLLKRGNCQTN